MGGQDDAERDITSRRLLQLYVHPIKGNFDYNHLKRIHRFLFQDIYSWAGKGLFSFSKRRSIVLFYIHMSLIVKRMGKDK